MTIDNLTPFYLLSGNGSCAEWWEDALPHFEKYRPMPLELPGFGENPSDEFHTIDDLAAALLAMTEPGRPIFAAGINGLVALHALVREPGHFDRVLLFAPVGAFLGRRRFVQLMSLPPARKTLHFLLCRFPTLFKRKFSSQAWPAAHYARMAEGYRKCRAFQTYFQLFRPDNSLTLFEWISDRVDLVWGTRDAILDVGQAAAWDSILPRAELTVTIRDDWGHYPYIDDPAGFARDLEAFTGGFPAHTKAGRLRLAELAGQPVPRQFAVSDPADAPAVVERLDRTRLYAVRSSGASEDHIDHSHAGRHHTFLRVPVDEVAQRASELLTEHQLETCVVQEFVEPRVSGVAFCRWLGLEVEYTPGHLEEIVSGEVTPRRAILSKLGDDWNLPPEPLPEAPQFDFDALAAFLREALRAFHFHPSDIEWAWDGERFHLLQIRPVTTYAWRRSLTSANLDELLPPRVSRLMEHAQRTAALSISRIYSLWDRGVLDDHEPFTAVCEDASYVNLDLFLSRLCDYGLPSTLISREIGGAAPKLPFHLGRFLASLPTVLKMHFTARRKLRDIEPGLRRLAAEFDRLLAETDDSSEHREAALVRWFSRYYVFIVQSNILINACISTSGGAWLGGGGKTIYRQIGEDSPHRLKFESDPATPRADVATPELSPIPTWSAVTRLLHRLGTPGLRGAYTEVREWFRDNNMKLFFRLHHALRDSEWLLPHEGERSRHGTFWQSGGETLSQDFSFVIYPGGTTGVVGRDILVVDALEPGHYEDYRRAKAVIARTGGRLSHGSTLLRELKKPSAVISDLGEIPAGTSVVYGNGRLEFDDASPDAKY